MSTYIQLKKTLLDQIKKSTTLEALEEVRLAFFGKKGELSEAMKALGAMDPSERREAASVLNEIKDQALEAFAAQKDSLEKEALEKRLRSESLDMTLSPALGECGKVHPLSHVIEEALNYFLLKGFSVETGDDVEDDFHNFTALNIPDNHPARQEHDTFYLKARLKGGPAVLRTHTSPVQIRALESAQKNGTFPLRMVVAGRTFRSDYDATHTPMFHQMEGLVVDKSVHMGHLKKCLQDFLEDFFGVKELSLRFRPSYFPFTEPSAEVDIRCDRSQDRLKIGEGSDWLEILGCGMVHPNVLRNVGIDPDVYQGFAFGVGLERLAMLKYGIPDLRQFYESDKRWLSHYGFKALSFPALIKGDLL